MAVTVIRSRYKMVAKPSKCCVCLICQLVCSLTKENMFNPSKARINVIKSITKSGSMDVKISFTEECDNCGICAKYCTSGALTRVRSGD